jgi:DNA-binding response OmpR family regulator
MAQNKKVLVAEDERPVAKALQLKLQNEGFDVDVAYNGNEAIDKLKKEKFNLMILDLIMPKLDGFGVLEEMKDKGIKVNTIVASNLSQDEDIKKAKKLGAKDFFVKADTPISKIIEFVKKNIS